MPVIPKLPDIKTADGDGLVDAAFVDWKGWIEYGNNLSGKWPVMVSKTAAGPVVSVDLSRAGLEKMVVTTEIGKAVGDECGSGQAKPAVFDEDAGELTPDPSADAVKVWSDNLDVNVKAGAKITVFKWSGVLWVFGVDSCGNLE